MLMTSYIAQAGLQIGQAPTTPGSGQESLLAFCVCISQKHAAVQVQLSIIPLNRNAAAKPALM